MKKVLKIFSCIVFFTVLLNAADFKIISPGGFNNSKILGEQAGTTGVALLATPNANNQFLVFDLTKPQNLKEIVFTLQSENAIDPADITIYSSMSIIPWSKVESKNSKEDSKYTISLPQNFGQYFKVVFGTKPRVSSLKLSKIEFIAQKELTQQKIIDISVTKATTNSAEISYETVQPAATQVVFGTNYDYVYGNVLEGSYSEPNLKLKHHLRLNDLQPNITYAYSIFAKDSSGKEIRSQILYFSTNVSKK